MGDLVGIRDKAIKIGQYACQLDKDKKYEEAFTKYIEAIELFKHVMKCIFIPCISRNKTSLQTRRIRPWWKHSKARPMNTSIEPLLSRSISRKRRSLNLSQLVPLTSLVPKAKGMSDLGNKKKRTKIIEGPKRRKTMRTRS